MYINIFNTVYFSINYSIIKRNHPCIFMHLNSIMVMDAYQNCAYTNSRVDMFVSPFALHVLQAHMGLNTLKLKPFVMTSSVLCSNICICVRWPNWNRRTHTHTRQPQMNRTFGGNYRWHFAAQ